jgi:transposase
MSEITTIGLDLAKSVFEVHGADASGRVRLRKTLPRAKVLEFFAQLPACVVGMEACGASNYWARKLEALGHRVRVLPPQLVKAYLQGAKNDAHDAQAICEAASRPGLRAVPIKTEAQQLMQSLHVARQGLVKSRTALSNQMRGLLAEFGVVLPLGVHQVAARVGPLVHDESAALPPTLRQLLGLLLAQWHDSSARIAAVEEMLQAQLRADPAAQRLRQIPGIGLLTATALVAAIGDARRFRNARQCAAWLGVVPEQHSSGGKTVLRGIPRRADAYLRTLLIHGARAVLSRARQRPAFEHSWLGQLLGRSNMNVAAVALANKNARRCWALLAHGRAFDPHYGQQPAGA